MSQNDIKIGDFVQVNYMGFKFITKIVALDKNLDSELCYVVDNVVPKIEPYVQEMTFHNNYVTKISKLELALERLKNEKKRRRKTTK